MTTLLLSAQVLLAQTEPLPALCGTTVSDATHRALVQDLPEIRAFTRSASAKTMNELDSVPIQVHFIGTSLGTNYPSTGEWLGDLAIANFHMEQAGIILVDCSPPNYVDDDLYFNWSLAEQQQFLNTYGTPGVLNVILPGGVTTSSSGNRVCGYSYFPWSGAPDIVVVDGGCLGGTTVTHEFGHFFGLYHTHGRENCGVNGSDELVSRVNCDVAGDFACDTPADPGLRGVECSDPQIDSNCNYTGTAVDILGDAYTPDVSNIMSYAWGICRATLSQEQYDRMAFYRANGREHLICPANLVDSAPLCEAAIPISCDGDPVVGVTGGDAQAVPFCYGPRTGAPGNWYVFTPDESGLARLSTCSSGTNFSAHIAAFQGNCGDLDCVTLRNEGQTACSDGEGHGNVEFRVWAGEPYYIFVSGTDGNAGQYELSVECAPLPPSTAICDNARPIGCGELLSGAVAEQASPSISCLAGPGFAGEWFVLTAPNSADYSATTCEGAGDFDSMLEVFVGADCDDLSCEFANDDDCGLSSTVTFYADAGQRIYLRVTGYAGELGAFNLSVSCMDVRVPPVAGFVADSICRSEGQVVNFSSTSTGIIDSYLWEFGDGGSSTEQNPSHTYTSWGSYDVALTVSGPTGQDINFVDNFVNVVPVEPLIIKPTNTDTLCQGSTAQFEGLGGQNFRWVDANGSVTSGSRLTATANETGTHVYQLMGSSVGGCPAVPGTLTLVVEERPELSMIVSEDSICANDRVELSASGSDELTWMGPGLSATTGANVSGRPTSFGWNTYTVTTQGCEEVTLSRDVWMREQTSIAITADSTTICVGQPVGLYATGADEVTWTGPFLENLTGDTVRALPSEVGEFTYEVSGMVNECPTLLTTFSLIVTDDADFCNTVSAPDVPPSVVRFSAYPNPNNGEALTLELRTLKTSRASIHLYDGLGRRVGGEIWSTTAGDNWFRFPVGNYTAGLYYLVVEIDGGLLRERVILR